MASLDIRLANPAEAALLAGLIVEAFEQYRGKLMPESGALSETPETIARELALADHSALLALSDHVPVGCVMVKPEDGDLYFGRLSVRPASRGHGIAPALVRAVEQCASDRGYPAVRLGVRVALPENQRLFASLGYVEIFREPHPGFNYPTSITMRKIVSARRL